MVPAPDKRGAFDRSMQHHLGTDRFKGDDYDPTEAVEIISHGEERHIAPMEVRAVLARNRARLRQATQLDSVFVIASRRHSSRRARGYFARDRLRIAAS